MTERSSAPHRHWRGLARQLAAIAALGTLAAAGASGTATAAAGPAASNTSATAGSTAVAGDLSGVGVPQVTVVSGGGYAKAAGSLAVFAAGSAPFKASDDAHSPEGDNWSDYVVTHHGSLTGGKLDDLLALNTSSHKLYLYPNDAESGGAAGHFTSGHTTQIAKPATCAPGSDCTGYDPTWNSTTQLVATDGIDNAAGLPDVLTVEGGKLWYYPGKAGSILGSPLPLGTGDWSNTTIVAPGKVGTAPTLWVRENFTGALATLPLAFKGDGTPAAQLAAPSTTQLANGTTAADGSHLCYIAGVEGGSCATVPVDHWLFGADGTVRENGGCLDSASATQNNPYLVTATCNGGANQKWVFGQSGTIVDSQSGRCLTSTDINYFGNITQLAACTGAPSQLWGTPSAQGLGPLPSPQAVLPLSLPQNTTELAEFGTAHTLTSSGDGAGGDPDLFTLGGWVEQYPGQPAVNGIARFGSRVEYGADSPRSPAIGAAQNGLSTFDVVYSNCAKLTLQLDGDLVLTKLKTGQVIWSSGTAGVGSAYAMVEADGSFGINRRADNQLMWSTRTPNSGGALLTVQDDCDLVLRAGATQLWSSDTAYWSTGQVVTAGTVLHGGDSVTSAGAELTLQTDGNLVLYSTATGQPLWSSVTWGHPGAWATVQPDGNIVVYDAGHNALWATGTNGNPGSRLSIQDDRNLVVYDANGKPLWSTGTWAAGPDSRGTSIGVGSSLLAGASVVAAGGHLDMQADGNLVLYSSTTGRALWSSVTWGHPGAWATMQPDGNLVVYAPGGAALWSSKSNGHPNAHTVVQNDNNVVVYDTQGNPLWASGTNGQS
ncbi:ricin-type beta-trefoil lectin domain protein [Kitasatospora sp. NPDC008050]|uniref:ricin-type beta-trefoil lectin domain protein n=1 Tax=Kitasatospora sp. NPDC008050 TaxID=3364021 RepID=UPI0036E9E0E0